MNTQARPSRSALLAALRNDGVRRELRVIGYVVDLQGHWFADELIFNVDRLEGNLEDLPSGPRQILERRAAAYMSIVPARSSHVPIRPASRPPGLARPSATSTWGSPSPDRWLLPRGGTGAWKRMHGMASTPTPTPTPAPLTIMPFADSSAVNSPEVYRDDEEDDAEDNAEGEYEAEHDWSHLYSGLPPTAVTAPNLALTATAVPSAGLPASLIMSPAPVAPSSFVSIGEEYRDDKKDDDKDDRDATSDDDEDEVEFEDTEDEDEDDEEDEDEEGEDEEGEYDEDDEYAPILPLVSWANKRDLFRSHLFVLPVAPVPAPAPADPPSVAPVPASTANGPAAVPAIPPLPTSAPAPTPVAAAAPAAAVLGLATVGYPIIPPPPGFPPIPAGFQLHGAPGRYFLTGPDWTGGVPNPPAMNFRGLRVLDGAANEDGACRFCKCSKWLWFPTFFQRANDPQGLKHTCNRCACRSKTSDRKKVGQQEWVRQRNEWLVDNRPIMFWLTRSGV
ncbi:hypothetical protein CcaCcLH18_08876 [Colletotrichum camelliae]|nr:hypothetical protein CcaCcLH18_08876 [Colletotrichum camelliae]